MSEVMIILILLIITLVIPTGIVFTVLGINKHKRKKKNKLYTSETKGVVERVRFANGVQVVYVVYTVDGESYIVSETLKQRTEAIKLWKIPIGQRKFNKIGPAGIGTELIIKYHPSKPNKAIIKGNDGCITD